MKHIKNILITTLSIMATTTFAVDTFPHHEDFESGFGDWIQSGTDDINWSRNIGPTGSSGTGPSSAHEKNVYAYTEASGSGYGYPNMEAVISAEFDFSALSNPAISFYYHMYGHYMGTLYVDVDNGSGSWVNVRYIPGQQHLSHDTSWSLMTVDLSAYGNMSNIKIRIRGVTGLYFTSDMCIDDVWVYDQPEAALTEFVWSPVSSLQDYGVPIPVEIKAVNSQGQTLTSFNKAVTLSAWSDGFNDAVVNGTFDTDLSGWTFMNVGSTPGPYSVWYSQWGSGLAFYMHPDNAADGISQEITLKGGETYQISAKTVVVNGNPSPTPAPVFNRILINDNVIDEESLNVSGDSQYGRGLYGTFVPPSDGTYTLKLISETASVQSDLVVTYFDDVSVSFAPPQSITTYPSMSGQFTNGVWAGSITLYSRLPETRIIARYADIMGESALFSTYTSALDLDRDGMLDSWENLYFSSPEDCLPLVDSDGDGYCNADEFTIGTIPTLKSSSLAFAPTNAVPGKFVLTWHSVSNRTYDIQWTPNLIITPFTDLDTGIGFPRSSFTNDIPAEGSMGFYRIKVHKN